MNDFGYYQAILDNLGEVNRTQGENITAAATLMADAIKEDRLIHVYGGGGHTTLPVGEMFFRAGGLACINPMMETGLSVFNQAEKYLALERTHDFGASIIKYFRLQPGDVVIIFHNIGVNPATIDAAMEIKAAGAKLIGRRDFPRITLSVTSRVRTFTILRTYASMTSTPSATPQLLSPVLTLPSRPFPTS